MRTRHPTATATLAFTGTTTLLIIGAIAFAEALNIAIEILAQWEAMLRN